jgi:hypothetical protein
MCVASTAWQQASADGNSSRAALGAGGHVGGKIQAQRGARGIGANEAAEHLARSGGYFQHAHAILNAGHPQRNFVGFGVEEIAGGWIDAGEIVVDFLGALGNVALKGVGFREEKGIIEFAQSCTWT